MHLEHGGNGRAETPEPAQHVLHEGVAGERRGVAAPLHGIGQEALIHGLRRPPVAPHAVHQPKERGGAEHRGARRTGDAREACGRKGARDHERAAPLYPVALDGDDRRARVAGEAERDGSCRVARH